MFKITTTYNGRDTSGRNNHLEDGEALIDLARQFAGYSRLLGAPWYIDKINERDGRLVLVSPPEGSDNAKQVVLTKCYEVVGKNSGNFHLLLMAAFFYAHATGAYSEAVGEYLKTSRGVTGLAAGGPATIPARLLPGH